MVTDKQDTRKRDKRKKKQKPKKVKGEVITLAFLGDSAEKVQVNKERGAA